MSDPKDIVICSPKRTAVGRYGGAFVGVPVQLGRKGVEKIIELKLTDDELKQLQASASHVAESVGKLKL